MILETAEIVLGLEAQQVVVEQRAHQRLVVRQRRENLRRRKWRVEEEPEPVARTQPAQFRGQRDQVEIVDPDQVRRPQQPRERRGKAAVDAPIGLEVGMMILRQVDAKMEERPQAAIREVVVVPLEVLLRQVERREHHAVRALAAQPGLARRDRPPAPAEPQPATLAQRIHDAHGEAARRCNALQRTDAVRNGHQPARRFHRTSSHPPDSLMAALMMPTSEYVWG